MDKDRDRNGQNGHDGQEGMDRPVDHLPAKQQPYKNFLRVFRVFRGQKRVSADAQIKRFGQPEFFSGKPTKSSGGVSSGKVLKSA